MAEPIAFAAPSEKHSPFQDKAITLERLPPDKGKVELVKTPSGGLDIRHRGPHALRNVRFRSRSPPVQPGMFQGQVRAMHVIASWAHTKLTATVVLIQFSFFYLFLSTA